MDMRTEKEGQKLIISFSGEIGEDAKFTKQDFNDIKSTVFDLENVTLLNSCGLRSWIFWVKEIPQEVVKVFKRCPRMVVDQMNILEGFIPPNSIIESFYIPFYCEDCDEEINQLAIKGEDYVLATAESESSVAIKEDVICPECNNEMDLDILPQRYFKFLRYRR